MIKIQGEELKVRHYIVWQTGRSGLLVSGPFRKSGDLAIGIHYDDERSLLFQRCKFQWKLVGYVQSRQKIDFNDPTSRHMSSLVKPKNVHRN